MIKKLRLRFVIVNMSIVSVILLAIFGMVYHFTERNLETQSLSMLRSVSVTPQMPKRPGEGNTKVSAPFFSMREEDGVWIADRGSFFDLSDEDYLRGLAVSAEAQESSSGTLKEYNLRYLRTETPIGTVLAFADTTGERETLSKLIETCTVIALLSFLVFLGISILLARWAVRPVEKAWQQQRQFIADASHELKTPLTVIQTSTELARQAEDGVEQLRYLDNISEMSHRMRSLVEQLLILARSDNQQTPAAEEQVDLSRTVSDAVLPFEPIFFEAGLSLRSEIDGGIGVKGNAAALRQLTDILLDNARKYSLRGGETVLSLQSSADTAMLCVSNPGAPMSAQQCRDIFKRFYRTDEARTGGESFGLGLSIAESIVQQHRGRIRAEYRDGVFSVLAELPLHI